MLSSDESNCKSDELLLTTRAYDPTVSDGHTLIKFTDAANLILESCPVLVPTPGWNTI